MENIRKLYRKTTVYVVRCNNQGILTESAPCVNCLNMMKYLDIKRVVYSKENDKFVSCKPCELEITHVSAGSKHLEKIKNYR